MALFSIEHGKAAYWADFGIYGLAVAILAVALATLAPRTEWPALAALAVLGAAAWTLIEYLVHRYVLHGLEPFLSWHAEHHERPAALICTPTLLSVLLVVLVVFLPVLFASSLWRATALTLGLMSGYLVYALTHHAIHHWRPRGQWLVRRKRWHARHHLRAGCYGVSSSFWDKVFGSAGKQPRSKP